MKVLFVYPIAPPEVSETGLQQGIASCSAVLKKNNHQTSLIYLSSFNKKEIKEIREKINSFRPGLIAISSTTDYIHLVRKFVDFVMGEFDMPIVLGGIHATIDPDDAIKIKGLKGVCCGEGEYALLELVNAVERGDDYTSIRNFWFKKGKKIIKNEIRPIIKDMNSLPFPDREIFNFQELLKHRRDAEFMGSRGCPFECNYCINHSLKGLYKGKGPFLRFRSVDNFLQEIKEAKSKYKFDLIGFHDDTFTIHKAWLKEFCEKYPKEIGISFWCNSRADTVNEEIMRMLKKAGCVEIRIAIESGNDHIRQDILNKKITKKQIIDAFALAKKYGIKTYTFNMIGLPYETEKNIKETIMLNRKVNPDTLQVSIFRPYPNTQLGNLCKKQGWVSERALTTYFDKESILNLPSISKEKLAYDYVTFKWNVKYPILTFFISWLYWVKVKDTNLFELLTGLRKKAVHYFGSRFSKKQKEIIKGIMAKLKLYDAMEI